MEDNKPYYRDSEGLLRVNACKSVEQDGKILNAGDIIQEKTQPAKTEEVDNEQL